AVGGGAPRQGPGRGGPAGRGGRGAAAGNGGRFPVPRAGRVRGAGRGVVFRPGSGRRGGAGAAGAAAGGGGGRVVVSGASGAGTSSWLRAGVLPRIRAGGLAAAPGAASWPYLVFTP